MRTRAFIPQDLQDLDKYTQEGERVLDSGCASGRLFEIFKNKKIDFYGIDFSKKLIELAKRKYPQANFQTINALNTPFKDNYFDKIYSISVLHNIPSQALQMQYLKEMRRILKPEGLIILRVWYFWKRIKAWKLFFRYTALKIIGKSKMDFYDIFLPWKNSKGEVMIQRYFHCFTKRKLIFLIERAGFRVRETRIQGKGRRANIYIIAEK